MASESSGTTLLSKYYTETEEFQLWRRVIIIILGILVITFVGFTLLKLANKQSDGEPYSWLSKAVSKRNQPKALNPRQNYTEMCNKHLPQKEFIVSSGGKILKSLNSRLFFIKDDTLLTDEDSCSLESVLKSFPNETVYSIELLCHRPKEILERLDYKALMEKGYGNLVSVSIEGDEFFKDTPLNGKWECDNDTALLSGMVLTSWLYGGTVISYDVLLNRPKLLRHKDWFSQYVLINEKRCNSFLYNLMTNHSSMKKIVNVNKYPLHSLDETCDNNKKYASIKNVCDHFSPNCVFLITEELKKGSGAWLAEVANLCPKVIQAFRRNEIESIEVPT